MLQAGCKVWLEKDGEKIFGPGPALLLQKVEALGSLRQAAFALDMSYTKAWRLVRSLEAALGIPILEKRIGGFEGGSSKLTPEAKALMNRYAKVEQEIEAAAAAIFRKHFP